VTLIELVIAIGIILIVIVISFPKDKADKYQLDSFARQLVSDIRYVRSMNINGNMDCYLENIKSNDDQRYIIKDNSDIIKTVYLPKKSNLSAPTSIIKFKSDGTLNSRGETISINSSDRKIEITIVPFSGRVLLKEGKYEN
jgi:Tfp pilus assembly protein FimT